MAQLQLFEVRTVDTDNLIRLMTTGEPRNTQIALAIMRSNDLDPVALLVQAVRKHWENSFEKVWDGFELNGRMEYLKINFGYYCIEAYENECGEFCVNKNTLYTIGLNDEFSPALTVKYKNTTINHILSNAVIIRQQITTPQ
jgi:hypothetical protein